MKVLRFLNISCIVLAIGFGALASVFSISIIVDSAIRRWTEEQSRDITIHFLGFTGISLFFIGLSYFISHVIDKSNSHGPK